MAAWGDNPEAGDSAEEPESIFEDFGDGSTKSELAAFIAELNTDEPTSLVALTWIGRGTYTVDKFEEAARTASAGRVNPTAVYLKGIPLFSDYLADGLE